jgi:hypothetical protein
MNRLLLGFVAAMSGVICCEGAFSDPAPGSTQLDCRVFNTTTTLNGRQFVGLYAPVLDYSAPSGSLFTPIKGFGAHYPYYKIVSGGCRSSGPALLTSQPINTGNPKTENGVTENAGSAGWQCLADGNADNYEVTVFVQACALTPLQIDPPAAKK